jgi:hypothetical protein
LGVYVAFLEAATEDSVAGVEENTGKYVVGSWLERAEGLEFSEESGGKSLGLANLVDDHGGFSHWGLGF